MEIEARVLSKKERIFEVGEELIRGWEIQLAPLEPDPTRQRLVFGGTMLVTFHEDVAAQFTVGEDLMFTLPLAPAPVKLALPGRMN